MILVFLVVERVAFQRLMRTKTVRKYGAVMPISSLLELQTLLGTLRIPATMHNLVQLELRHAHNRLSRTEPATSRHEFGEWSHLVRTESVRCTHASGKFLVAICCCAVCGGRRSSPLCEWEGENVFEVDVSYPRASPAGAECPEHQGRFELVRA